MNDSFVDEAQQLSDQEWLNATNQIDDSFDEPEYSNTSYRSQDRGMGGDNGLLPACTPGRSQTVASPKPIIKAARARLNI